MFSTQIVYDGTLVRQSWPRVRGNQLVVQSRTLCAPYAASKRQQQKLLQSSRLSSCMLVTPPGTSRDVHALGQHSDRRADHSSWFRVLVASASQLSVVEAGLSALVEAGLSAPRPSPAEPSHAWRASAHHNRFRALTCRRVQQHTYGTVTVDLFAPPRAQSRLHRTCRSTCSHCARRCGTPCSLRAVASYGLECC